MTDEPVHSPGSRPPSVEMPAPTAAPIVLSTGMVVLASGVVFGPAFFVVGFLLVLIGLASWISCLLPGRGHIHEELADAAHRPGPLHGRVGTVGRLVEGVPGYRLRLPVEVHPISAGVKGGLVGGLVMPIPALLYGVFSGHGIWFPINLLAGMALPGVDDMTIVELEKFHFGLLLLAVVIHVTMALVIGLAYGVLMPTLPDIPLASGVLLMPLLWSGVSYPLLKFANPLLFESVSWPWFFLSQFIFGVMAALVVQGTRQHGPVQSGLLGGLVGGLVMPIPAMLWGLATRHGVWYPVNLLAGMVTPRMSELPLFELESFRLEWFMAALTIHAALSAAFGIVYGLLIPRLKPIPAPLAWGGMLLPLLWTATSYALMGVVNPVLREHVEWPWYIVSQFVFGIAAAVVVVRSEKVAVPPAGTGPGVPLRNPQP